MQPLERSLRRELERTIQQAREIAEAAARTALTQLGVAEAKAYDYLSDAQRDLRRRLRVHGRQLGDELKAAGGQETERLLEEVAYEHWHRMLFARFLAENNLLMYPDPQHPVPVTLAECEELALDEGAKNGWELAARFASQMLPQIFRQDSPVLELTLPPENQQRLESLLAKLPAETFIASDALGWVYQFWQAKKKDEVNASEVKIGARELPAVTQLFTEPYMVSFLLDNSLGAWWAARRLTDDDLQNAETEAELRQKASVSGVPLEYLRFVREEETGKWTPAAGTFDAWPKNLSELKTLDPCCGSGHFLVSALLMLAPMRAELENLTPREACDAVLRDNLHGLELDQRCVEIAAFALALTAWRYGGYHVLPELQLACSGLSINTKQDEWISLADGDRNLEIVLEDLYKQFSDAPTLGSLLNPFSSLGRGTLFELGWRDVGLLLDKALGNEQDIEKSEMAIAAKGIAQAADILSKKYTLVLTNVPYLSLKKQSLMLANWITERYPTSKQNLAVVFIERCFTLIAEGGTGLYVCPQDWIFINVYKDFRKNLLNTSSVEFLIKLGTKAFSTPMWDMNIMMFGVSQKKPKEDSCFLGIDLSNHDDDIKKASDASRATVEIISQKQQFSNPDARIVFGKLVDAKSLEHYSDALMGVSTGDGVRFQRYLWEIEATNAAWEYIQSTVSNHIEYGGRSQVIFWQNEQGEIFKLAESVKHLNHSAQNWQRGRQSWGKKGVVISQMGSLPVTIYTGEIYDTNCCAIVPNSVDDVLPLWVYATSSEFNENVRQLNQALKVSPGALLQTGFDRDKWNNTAKKLYPHGLPKPYSDDPTQWIFHGHPCGSVIWNEDTKRTDYGTLRSDNTVLQVAVARLLGYRFPAELDDKMELSDEARAWVKKCDALLPFADRDGVVCIPPVRGERPGAERLLNLLAAAYGDSWNNDVLSQLLASADHVGKSLETWLRDKFFTQHCALFGQRPFIWHIWDGLRDGFSVLVNYHKLDYKLLETLIYNYLGDWIARQKQDVVQKVDGAQEKLAGAETLQKRLILILKGDAPHDIFVRWKPLHEQPIGWQPDINDGVRLNIRPFMSVPDVGKKGAGVLRDKPKIDWGKDRGKDVEYSFWYPLFKGDRINDHHLTLAEKQAARDKKRETD